MKALGLDKEEHISNKIIDNLKQFKKSWRKMTKSNSVNQSDFMNKMHQPCPMCEKLAMTSVDLLKSCIQTNIKAEQMIKNSIFSSLMTTNLINDLLDLAKLENKAF